MPPAQGAEAIVGQEGVALGAGIDPDGIVRVASEEWRAVAPAAPDRRRARRSASPRLDGLVLTVEPIIDEHAPAGGAGRGRRNPA